MEQHIIFDYIKQTRAVFVQLLEQLSLEEINKIPQGFRNNIGWNFGHIVVSTPGLCYRRTQVMPAYDIPFASDYGKGTKPERWIGAAELDTLKGQLVSSIQQIETDYNNGVFARISPYATSTYGLEINTIEEVFTATLAHDNLHYGYAMAIRRALVGSS
ncbi:DinB family protein [Parapedobacter koreensis]|uniref:DinB superfamily protein n=1 Tax=Parapedobacter koreensis TaxID=332977 RepID=A0A1H7F8E3_9SPHI|nr:DinB family protein [Parapedobacter koreensis]SEK20632.1 DinB superfamily protein [Parapedobacter koreensis]